MTVFLNFYPFRPPISISCLGRGWRAPKCGGAPLLRRKRSNSGRETKSPCGGPMRNKTKTTPPNTGLGTQRLLLFLFAFDLSAFLCIHPFIIRVQAHACILSSSLGCLHRFRGRCGAQARAVGLGSVQKRARRNRAEMADRVRSVRHDPGWRHHCGCGHHVEQVLRCVILVRAQCKQFSQNQPAQRFVRFNFKRTLSPWRCDPFLLPVLVNENDVGFGCISDPDRTFFVTFPHFNFGSEFKF